MSTPLTALAAVMTKYPNPDLNTMDYLYQAGKFDHAAGELIREHGEYFAAMAESLIMANHMAENVKNYLRSREDELARIKRLAETGSAESFLSLSDDDKRKWFAMALRDSHKLTVTEQRLARLITSAESVIAAIDSNHDTKQAPSKYTVPWAVVTDLRETIDEVRP